MAAFINNTYDNYYYIWQNGGWKEDGSYVSTGYFGGVSRIIGSNKDLQDHYRAVRIGFTISGSSTTTLNFKFKANPYHSNKWIPNTNDFVVFVSTDKNILEGKTKDTLLWGENVTTEDNHQIYANYNNINGTYYLSGEIKHNFYSNTKYYLYIVPTLSMKTGICWLDNIASYPGTFITGPEVSYSITYNPNGGSNAPITGTKYHGKEYTISNFLPAPPPDKKTESTDNIKITLNGNGGVFKDKSSSISQEGKKTTTITTISTFNYWLGSDNIHYNPNDIYTTNNNLTLMAKWKETKSDPVIIYSDNQITSNTETPFIDKKVQIYKVYLNVNGGRDTLQQDQNTTYTFIGWSKTQNGPIISLPATFLESTALYAEFAEIKDPIPTFILPNDLKQDEKIFLGWSPYKNSAVGNFTFTPTSLETDLYPVWKNKTKYSITIESNDYITIKNEDWSSIDPDISPIFDFSKVSYTPEPLSYEVIIKNPNEENIIESVKEANNYYSIYQFQDKESGLTYSPNSSIIVNKNYTFTVISQIPFPKLTLQYLWDKLQAEGKYKGISLDEEATSGFLALNTPLTPDQTYYFIDKDVNVFNSVPVFLIINKDHEGKNDFIPCTTKVITGKDENGNNIFS